MDNDDATMDDDNGTHTVVTHDVNNHTHNVQAITLKCNKTQMKFVQITSSVRIGKTL
jgi:hypothetical protein